MATDPHKRSAALATGALMDIIGRGQALQAAVIRGATGQEIEVMRAEVHSVVDAYLDHTFDAAMHVRALTED